MLDIYRHVRFDYNPNDLRTTYDAYNPNGQGPGYFRIYTRGTEGEAYTILFTRRKRRVLRMHRLFGPVGEPGPARNRDERRLPRNSQIRGVRKIFKDRVIKREGGEDTALLIPDREVVISFKEDSDARPYEGVHLTR